MANRNWQKGFVCGIGISDDGKYPKRTPDGKKDSREYAMWQKMIARCYYDKSLKKEPTYQDCTVSDEFLSFQTFAKFYEENKWTDELILIPDKDILTHGRTKIYSRDTIVFADKLINTIFTKRQNKRGDLPIGVSIRNYPTCTKYVATVNKYGKSYYLGLFNTISEAFNAYKTEKEKYIKEVANDYKNKYPNFPDKLYKAMMEYEVFEND